MKIDKRTTLTPEKLISNQINIETPVSQAPKPKGIVSNSKCEFCGKSFCKSIDLMIHAKTCRVRRDQKCTFCEKVFRLPGKLKKHIEIDHSQRTHK